MKKQNPPQIGAEIILEISGVTNQGLGIGRFNDLVVFAANTLAGEKVRARITKVYKNYSLAQALELIQISPSRVEPLCPYFQECGGCSLQHASYPHQLEIKRQILQDCLERIGGFQDLEVEECVAAPEPYHYRNRGRLQVSGHKLGFYARESKSLVETKACLVWDEALNSLLKDLKGELAAAEGLVQVSLQKGKEDDLGLVLLTRFRSERNRALAEELVQKFPKLAYVAENINPKADSPVFGGQWRHLAGREFLETSLRGLDFCLSPGSFIQVNGAQTENLYREILRLAQLKGNETVLDIYCGVGTIGLYLAAHCGKVLGVEDYPPAIENAKLNARLNRIDNAEFFSGAAQDILPKWAKEGLKSQVVVVDPPRKGCDVQVIEAICEIKPERIIYVSCDPATLARDLKAFCQRGCRIQKVKPFDMFPQGVNLETVSLISRI